MAGTEKKDPRGNGRTMDPMTLSLLPRLRPVCHHPLRHLQQTALVDVGTGLGMMTPLLERNLQGGPATLVTNMMNHLVIDEIGTVSPVVPLYLI